MMRASVVITNHDYEAFVGRAIESALGQEGVDELQVVVVDDGSTDGSPEVISRYGKRIEAVFKPPGGQTSALNAGFERVDGEVVCFLDSDDVLLPTAIADAVAALAATGAAKVHWPLHEVDAAGTPTGRVLPLTGDLSEGDVRPQVLRDGPEACTSPPQSGNLWRTEVVRPLFPLPEFERGLGVGSAHADALLSLIAAMAGPVARLREPHGLYRVHRANDYAGTPFHARIRRHAEIERRHFEVAQRWAARLGLTVDTARWAALSWFQRLARLTSVVELAVPSGADYVLIDGAEWGADVVAGRRGVPLIGRDGVDWGPPGDDGAAVEAVEARRRSGATHVVVGWPAFWWLDHYRVFGAYLRNFARVAATGEAVVYDLRRPLDERAVGESTGRVSTAPAEVAFWYAPPPRGDETVAPSLIRIAGTAAHDHVVAHITRMRSFYELDLLEHLARHGPRGGVFLDVGANIGNHSVYFGKFLADAVVCIEPNPAVLPALRRNLARNGVPHLVVPAGVGAGHGVATVELPHEANMGAARLRVGAQAGSPGSVPVSTLDSVVRTLPEWLAGRPITFIKLDIEGMEIEALQGATELIRRHRPHLAVEFSDQARARELWALLADLGYEDRGRFCWTPTHHLVPPAGLT